MILRPKKWFFTLCPILIVASITVQNQTVWASTSPLAVIRSTTNHALSILQDASCQDEGQRQRCIDKMWEAILPNFDTEEIAQRSLGLYWRNLTDQQKQKFVQLFVQLVKQRYGTTLERYAADAHFFFDRERLDGDFAAVSTRVVTPARAEPFSLVYRLQRKGDTWQIYDVVAENVSLVRNYRTQFYRIISRSSFANLLATLERKIRELKAA